MSWLRGEKKVNLPRLVVLTGAGGVGKTTLSAALALSHASQGARVGLLSIDPARRLRSALGLLHLGDEGATLSLGRGEVWVAELQPEVCLRRWVVEAGGSGAHALLRHPFFETLATRLAGASDVFAAARIAEMAQGSFDFVVVDTAPGLHALDFISHPDRTMAFLDGRLFEWLQGLAEAKGGWIAKAFREGARKLLGGLGALGGEGFLLAFADFLVLLQPMLTRLAARLDVSRQWFRSPESTFFVVATARPDSLVAAEALASALREQRLPLCAAVLNRAWPPELRRDPGFVTFIDEVRKGGAVSFAAYLEVLLERERRARERLEALAGRVTCVPLSAGLSGEMRLRDLAELGDFLRAVP